MSGIVPHPFIRLTVARSPSSSVQRMGSRDLQIFPWRNEAASSDSPSAGKRRTSIDGVMTLQRSRPAERAAHPAGPAPRASRTSPQMRSHRRALPSRVEIVHGQLRLAARFLEGHRGDRLTVVTFVVGPDQARVRCHFEVPTEELHGRALVTEDHSVPAPDANIRLAGEQLDRKRLRRPPPLEQLGLGPRLEHDCAPGR